MGFRQEYWSGLPCPPPGDLSDPGMGPESSSSGASKEGVGVDHSIPFDTGKQVQGGEEGEVGPQDLGTWTGPSSSALDLQRV